MIATTFRTDLFSFWTAEHLPLPLCPAVCALFLDDWPVAPVCFTFSVLAAYQLPSNLFLFWQHCTSHHCKTFIYLPFGFCPNWLRVWTPAVPHGAPPRYHPTAYLPRGHAHMLPIVRHFTLPPSPLPPCHLPITAVRTNTRAANHYLPLHGGVPTRFLPTGSTVAPPARHLPQRN